MKKYIIEENVKHRDPFKAPDGYFDILADRVLDRIHTAEVEKPVKIASHTSIPRLIAGWSAAASILLVASFGLWQYMNTDGSNNMAEAKFSNENTIVVLDEYYASDFTDAELEYAMIDNDDIEYYLSEIL